MTAAHSFKVSVRHLGRTAIVDLRGEINRDADDALTAAYAEAESGPSASIALNFGQVTFINSTGIALIVGLLVRARKNGCPIQVFGLSSHYEKVFRITNLAHYMTLYPDEASVLRAVI